MINVIITKKDGTEATGHLDFDCPFPDVTASKLHALVIAALYEPGTVVTIHREGGAATEIVNDGATLVSLGVTNGDYVRVQKTS